MRDGKSSVAHGYDRFPLIAGGRLNKNLSKGYDSLAPISATLEAEHFAKL